MDNVQNIQNVQAVQDPNASLNTGGIDLSSDSVLTEVKELESKVAQMKQEIEKEQEAKKKTS